MIDTALESFTHRFTKIAGSASGFIVALVTIVAWLLAGCFYEFSTKWQNAMQIYIGILTFLMIFLIQRGQNKEIATLQLKLDELILVTQPADNTLVNATELSENQLREAHETHRKQLHDDTPK